MGIDGLWIALILLLLVAVGELNSTTRKEYKQLKYRIEELEETVKELQDERVIENYEKYKANKSISSNTFM